MLWNERRCVACHAPFVPVNAEQTCADCTAELIDTALRCMRCGQKISTVNSVCGECLHRPPLWDKAIVSGSYDGLLRALLLRAKFGGDSAALDFLGVRMAASFASAVSENERAGLVSPILVPIALHYKRLRARGFNQSAVLARHMSKCLNIPMNTELLVRVRDSRPQRGLDKNARMRNARDLFAFGRGCIDGRDIILVDDVLTTGATLNAAAIVLRHAKARSVYVACVARDEL